MSTVGILTPPFAGVYGPRPYEAQSKQQKPQESPAMTQNFSIGDRVRKIRGSSWNGRVCGTYSTVQTPTGYCVESEFEPGSVQIYPASALELAERKR